MENQKQYCENLYAEYKELKPKTTFHVQRVIPGKELNPQYIKPEELLRRVEIVKELKEKCKPHLDLKPHEWFEIERE